MASKPKADVQLPEKAEDFGYLTLPTDYVSGLPAGETFKEKFSRKFWSNPFVPIGLGVTTVALCYGLWQMQTGNRKKSQQMMRLRVGAQGFTVVALLAGVAYNGHQMKQERLKKEALAAHNK